MSEPTTLLQRAARAARLAGAGTGIEDVRPLTGGHSGVTLAADLIGGDGTRVPIAIKAAPPGRAGVGRHDVLRQATLFRALEAFAGVRVPHVHFSDAEDPPFFAMDLLRGEAREPVLEPQGALAPDLVRARAMASAGMLAALHAGDPSSVGLGPGSSIGEEVDRWASVMAAVDPELVPGHERLLAALRATVPQQVGESVVHGDYRLGNIICDGSEITAVIDWEIWCVSDPRLDLGWYLVHFDPSEYPGIAPETVPGLPSRDEVLKQYEAASGNPVADEPWFDAFGRYKLAAIMGHNLRRHREGRHEDPFQERLPATISLQVRRGLDVLG